MKKRSFIQVPRFMTLNVWLGLQRIPKLASFVSNFGVGESIKQKPVIVKSRYLTSKCNPVIITHRLRLFIQIWVENA